MSSASELFSGALPERSKEARRMAALVLEALGGLRSAPEAADAMGVALGRYYVLERRAIRAVVAAMERRPRGRQRTLEAKLALARREIERLEREVLRYQALHRAASRAIGVPAEDAGAAGARGRKKKTSRVRRKSRTEKILPRLAEEDPLAAGPSESAGSDAIPPGAEEVDDAGR